ncbi:MAG: hypothetical protein WKI04_18850 [Ferruginibacter sp.]
MPASKNFLRYAFKTGILAGTLDLAGAIVNHMITFGQFPYKILEYIASGAFGKVAMNGSLGYNLWGLFFHYLIAVSFTILYFFIYPGIKLLQKNVLLSAVLYGLFVWAVTNMILLPLSALQTPFIPINFIAASKNAFILIICIGLPVAYFTKKFYDRYTLFVKAKNT